MVSSSHINLVPEFECIKNDDAMPCSYQPTELENYFAAFQKNIIGQQQSFESPFGKKEIVYADWTASGRAYKPIEEFIQKEIMPFVANTHTGTTVTGTLMSQAYEKAKSIIKEHVNAGDDDALIFCGSGTTAAVNKLQRILGFRVPERLMDHVKNEQLQIDEELRPVVFVTHMEHHSNHISWLETIATVEIIRPAENGNVDLEHFRNLLEKFKYRKNKIAAVTACSNVTGIQTPYHEIARLVHAYDGLCFVDFACSAPYVNIDMHQAADGMHLDAIYFSPHKFLGGPGTPGVLIFSKKIYTNLIPDQPGGGTIVYSNPWAVHEYITNIEQREDGGTPPFLQAIKAAMCIKLKEEMGVENIWRREEEMLQLVFARLSKMVNVEILQEDIRERLPVISFIVNGAHHNLIVKLLNDRFGIQLRAGCSCAGTYGHVLLHVDKKRSYEILNSIRSGDLSNKPGWIRLSLHPTMTNAAIEFILDAIELTAGHFREWMKDYRYDHVSNEYFFKGIITKEQEEVENWFDVTNWG
jgi:selenocysteine lyase/cysteine desulfurase